MTYIVGGRIVLPDQVLTGCALAYDEKISEIIKESEVPDGADTIDAKGNLIAPGLVDIHIHGYMNMDTSDGDPNGVKIMAEGIIKNGVTSFLPTTMTVSQEEIDASLDSVRKVKEESKTWCGAEILGVHAEGPFINPNKKGAQAADNIQKPSAEFVLKNADIIKSITLAPEMDVDHSCIKEVAAKCDVLLSMGHTDADYEEAMKAVDDGISHTTHLFNAMTPLNHRNPGVVGAALSADVTCELIADTFHIHKGLYDLVYKMKKDKLVLITDCTRAGGMPDGEYSLGGQPIYLEGIECRLADGTIAGSVLKLNEAVHNFSANSSVPLHEVIAMASLYPARAIKCDSTKGSLEVGKDADIIIADDNFNIIKTIKGGKTIYES